VRYYKISELPDRESDGIMVIIFEILSYSLSFVNDLVDLDENSTLLLALVSLVVMMSVVVYKVRVVSGIAKVFGLKVRWIILWAVFPWMAALWIGYSKNIWPVNLDQYENSSILGGLEPARLETPVVQDRDSDTGLVVHLKDRTVRVSGKKRYLLKDINLVIPNGSLVLLLGGSGSGKTTLVNAIIGYEKANATVKLNGMDVYTNYSQMKYKIGFVPQQDLLRMNDTTMNTLLDAARLRMPANVKLYERKAKVDQVLDILGLTSGKEGLVSKKSGGMRKRISIGTELICDPDLFVLDEPDSGLDGVIARELFEKLRSVADSGKIVLVITHTPDRVADLFDKVIVLARDSGRVGRLAFYGSPDEAREFFDRQTMEQIVMVVNSKNEGGEGRADEMITKYNQLMSGSEVS
nr:ABC transporter ATP-binding protein [Solobacterium sp.]